MKAYLSALLTCLALVAANTSVAACVKNSDCTITGHCETDCPALNPHCGAFGCCAESGQSCNTAVDGGCCQNTKLLCDSRQALCCNRPDIPAHLKDVCSADTDCCSSGNGQKPYVCQGGHCTECWASGLSFAVANCGALNPPCCGSCVASGIVGVFDCCQALGQSCAANGNPSGTCCETLGLVCGAGGVCCLTSGQTCTHQGDCCSGSCVDGGCSGTCPTH
jgi:hypothetical protein